MSPIAPGAWDYRWSRCANAALWAGVNHSLFQFGPPAGRRSTLHYQCADQGPVGGIYEFKVLSLLFNVSGYLERTEKLAKHDHALQQFREKVDLEQLQSGLAICAPVGVCLKELEGTRAMRHRDLEWWMRLSNLTVAAAGHFLCGALMWSFLGQEFDILRVLLDLPIPHPSECTAAFASAGADWIDDARAAAMSSGTSSISSPTLAICVQGAVRSFTRPEVHLSLRDNVVRSLNASSTRIFYVLNLTSDSCTWCGNREVREVSLAEVTHAMAAVGQHLTGSLTLEPPCCWPELSPGLDYSDCFPDNLAAPVQARGKQVCENAIRAYEFSYDMKFDWVLWTRPDIRWRFPLGDIRYFSPDHVYAPYSEHLELSDLFALVPERSMHHYMGAYRDWTVPGHKFFCITRSVEARARQGRVCDFPGIDGCWRCGFGSIGCLLEKYLLANGVPLRRIPFELVERTRKAELEWKQKY